MSQGDTQRRGRNREGRWPARATCVASALLCVLICTVAAAQERQGTLAQGEPLFKALRGAGASPAAILDLVTKVQPQLDLERSPRPGDAWSVTVGADGAIVKFAFDGKRGAAQWPLSRAAARKAKREAAAARKRAERAERDKARAARLEARARAREEDNAVGEPVPTGDLLAQWFAAAPRDRAALEEAAGRKWSSAVLRRKLAGHFRFRGIKPGLHTFKTEAGATYSVVVPRMYNPRRASPLHMSLHGGGGNGPQNCRSRWDKHGGLGRLLVVCPTSPSGHWTTAPAEAIALGVLADVQTRFHISSDQVSLGGGSNGGTGTWHLAAKYPWIWAAVVPRAGVRLRKEPYVDNLAHLPAFVIHGARDSQIHVSNSTWMVAELRKRRADVTYVEVEEGGHKFFAESLNPRVIKWVTPKKRRRRKSIEWVNPRGAVPEVVDWVSIAGVGTVKATIKGQVVVLETDRAPDSLRVWLPRGLIDARKPVRVVLNGKEVHRGRGRDSAALALESFGLTGDLRRVFSAAIDVDLSRK